MTRTPKHDGNVITKFADDTYLIIPARNSHTRGDEVSHVKSWSSNNNLQLNSSKSHEIVFRSRRLRGKADQRAVPSLDIKRVDKLTILGVVVNNSLTATDHVSSLLASCSSLLYPSTQMSWPRRPVTERRVSCYGEWEVNVLRASLAWFLFYCRLRETGVFFAPLCKDRLFLLNDQPLLPV